MQMYIYHKAFDINLKMCLPVLYGKVHTAFPKKNIWNQT